MYVGLYYKLIYFNKPKLTKKLLLISKDNMFIFISKDGYHIFSKKQTDDYKLVQYKESDDDYIDIQMKRIELEYLNNDIIH